MGFSISKTTVKHLGNWVQNVLDIYELKSLKILETTFCGNDPATPKADLL